MGSRLLFILILGLCEAAWAQTDSAWVSLSESEIYERCYERLVRDSVPYDDAIAAQVKAGSLKGATACLRLFDRAQLQPAGESIVLPNRSDRVGIAILKTFNDFHRSLFQNKVFLTANTRTPAALIYDQEEPALYFTRALLGKDVRFDSVVNSETGIAGVRERSMTPELSNFQAQRIFSWPRTFPAYSDFVIGYEIGPSIRDVSPMHVLDSDLTLTGALVGVKSRESIVVPASAHPLRGAFTKGSSPEDMQRIPLSTCKLGGVVDPTCLIYKEKLQADSANINLARHFGGGILGSFGFIGNNSNLVADVVPFYELQTHRRLGSRIYEDLMCMQMPVLNASDVPAGEVKVKSPYPFRRSSSCMSCHHAIDKTASIYRNKFMTVTATPNVNVQSVGIGLPYIVDLGAAPSTGHYNLQGEVGSLIFRQRLGSARPRVVRADVNSIKELGKAIAAQREFYDCAAKRYYQFFTGINVNLTAPETDPVSKRHQDFVLSLGAKLKTEQNLRTLVQRILASPQYKTRNFQAEDMKK